MSWVFTEVDLTALEPYAPAPEVKKCEEYLDLRPSCSISEEMGVEIWVMDLTQIEFEAPGADWFLPQILCRPWEP